MLIINITLNIWKIKLLLNCNTAVTKLNILLCTVFFNHSPDIPINFFKRHFTVKIKSGGYFGITLFLFKVAIKRNFNIFNNTSVFQHQAVKFSVLVIRNIEHKFKAVALRFKAFKLTRRIYCFQSIFLFAEIKIKFSPFIIKRTCGNFINSRC